MGVPRIGIKVVTWIQTLNLMQKFILLISFSVYLLSGCTQNRYQFNLENISSENLKFAPEYYTDKPDLPSPALSEAGRELVLLKVDSNRYTWVDATVENGEPFDYKRNLYGKGNQLMADEDDFPDFARTGIHSETELRKTKIITGRSVSRITIDGRPWASSGVGFMADDETIMSVLWADNQTVKNLGLTHPDIARPLFHLWNISREFENYSIDTISGNRLIIEAMIYNGNEVKYEITGSRGWQESIFNDEILGSGHIGIFRDINNDEQTFLETQYGHLSQEQSEKMQTMLYNINTGEMVGFYINRYGFYEGYTEYRIDPIAAALIFGMRSIEEVHQASGGDLYGYFTTHSTKNHE